VALTEEQGLRMASHMKERGDEIIAAIKACQLKWHGVVALKFSNECREMAIEILDEPYDPNVKIFPGLEA
jgi:hypothetical protein